MTNANGNRTDWILINKQGELFDMPEELKSRYMLTSKETAEMLRVSQRWLEKNRKKSDAIPYIRMCRKVFYRFKDVTDWVDRHKKSQKTRLKSDQNEKES